MWSISGFIGGKKGISTGMGVGRQGRGEQDKGGGGDKGKADYIWRSNSLNKIKILT